MSDYTVVKWSDVENAAAGFGFAEDQLVMRFGRGALGCKEQGVTFAKFGKGFKGTLGHTQKAQEEVYVIVSGTAEMNIDGTVSEVGPGSAVRVGAGVWRAFRAKGDEDVTMIITGAPVVENDGEIDMEWWPN